MASGKLTLTALPPDFGAVAFQVFAASLATLPGKSYMKADATLFCKPPNADGNGEPDHDHVHNQPENQVV